MILDETFPMGTPADNRQVFTDLCREPAVLQHMLETAKWADVDSLVQALAEVGGDIVQPLCSLLPTRRKQAMHIVASVLATIGDAAACEPLLAAMESQASQSNAIRARDALILIGAAAVPTLTQGLVSPKWETRYFCVQALGTIGSPEAANELVEIEGDDKSAKVRQAAGEALRLLHYVRRDQPYATLRDFFNPYVVEDDVLDWPVDVVNARKTAVRWRFRLDAFDSAGLSYDTSCLRPILRSHAARVRRGCAGDCIVLGGDVSSDRGPMDSCAVAVLCADDSEVNRRTVVEMLVEVDAELKKVPGYERPQDHWLGDSLLLPLFRLSQSGAIMYDRDNSHCPDETLRDSDDNYGTDLTFTFAKAGLDASWVILDNISGARAKGLFEHVPVDPNANWMAEV